MVRLTTQVLNKRLSKSPAGKKFDEQHYRDFFRSLTGKTPYAYQTELAKELIAGRSVVLRAPTGAGKTWATVVPFLYTRIENQPSPDRLIYALPLRSLASSLHESTMGMVKKLTHPAIHVCTSARDRHYSPEDPFYITLQMGGQQDDPFFEGDIVFTTIDQLLSSYLFAPVSLPERVGNIGAGALIGSLAVFDEVHLLDPSRSLATSIEMLDRLKNLSQFVFMTATMPDSVLCWLEGKLGAKGKTLSPDEVLKLPSHATKERSFMWVQHSLTADDIIGQHEDHKGRTIAIVNTVGRAQALFREVRNKAKELFPPPEILLLHSRFYPEDRQYWESQLDSMFGPEASRSNAILISTQVVEAGIDISADVLLTELAPLSSLIQRAGRVARYQHPRDTGKFVVFELPTDNNGTFKLGPYMDQAEAVDSTRCLFVRLKEEKSVNYLEELAWLNEVHATSDLAALSHLDSLHAHRKHVLEAMDGLDESACSRLIRDISSVSVILTDKPEQLSFAGKRWPELLGVPRSSLFQLKEACSKAQKPEWVLKIPIINEIESLPAAGLSAAWEPVTNPTKATWLVAIHPNFASYSREVGLELGQQSENTPAVRYAQPSPLPRYSYKREAFVIHANRIVKQAQRIMVRHSAMIRSLCDRHPEVPVTGLVELVCALHDTGKLQIDWQREAQKWQRHFDSTVGVTGDSSEPLAHTTYDPERDKGNPLLPRFPPHASCGAFAALDYFGRHFPSEATVLCTAVGRHHGAHTKRLQTYELVSDAREVLEECLPANAPRPLSVCQRASRVDAAQFPGACLLHFSEDQTCWPLYVGLVRILRLADQGSFQDQS